MRTLKMLVVSGLVASSVAFAAAAPVLAWHPKGIIVKKVQNQTTASQESDANTAAAAVATKPGDIVKYIIGVSNIATPASNGYNDMHFTVLTDTLPAGVELVADPAKRTITEDLGVLKPGETKTREYLVKVTSTTNGALIDNKACFTGDSKVKDKPQADCDNAIIKVNVPTPTPPVEPPKEAPKTPEPTPAVLPATGPEAILAGATGIAGLGYGLHSFLRSKRDLTRSFKR